MSYNILVVDDSRVTRKVIVKTITLSGMPVGEMHEASNGKEALDILKNSWIDLVLADINMPVMNGMEMVDEMNRLGLMGTIPVVIVSTERGETRIQELKAKGVSAYLRKPFTPENIREIVEEVLGATAPDDDKNGHG